MKRLLRLLKDLVLGALLGYLGGMFIYCGLLLVLVNTLKDRKQAQATSFMAGMAAMPHILAAKILHGQISIGKGESNQPKV